MYLDLLMTLTEPLNQMKRPPKKTKGGGGTSRSKKRKASNRKQTIRSSGSSAGGGGSNLPMRKCSMPVQATITPSHIRIKPVISIDSYSQSFEKLMTGNFAHLCNFLRFITPKFVKCYMESTIHKPEPSKGKCSSGISFTLSLK